MSTNPSSGADNMQVTAGYGVTVATENKGGAMHQRVIAHRQRAQAPFQPPAIALTYSAGQSIGGEMEVENLVRLAGDFARLETLLVTATPATDGGPGPEFDLFLYQSPLTATPVDGQAPAVTPADAAGLQAVISVRQADYVFFGGQLVARLPLSGSVQASAGAQSLFAAMVAFSTVVLPANDAVSLVLGTVLD